MLLRYLIHSYLAKKLLVIYTNSIDSIAYYATHVCSCNFGGVGTARILAEKTLAVGRGKAHSIFELTRPDNFLADKTLADWQ